MPVVVPARGSPGAPCPAQAPCVGRACGRLVVGALRPCGGGSRVGRRRTWTRLCQGGPGGALGVQCRGVRIGAVAGVGVSRARGGVHDGVLGWQPSHGGVSVGVPRVVCVVRAGQRSKTT